MADPYVGEIRIFAGTYAPVGWLFCDGQLRQISTDQNLFKVLGTTYGGNGTTNFALPDLRGRAPVHQGNGFTRGQIDGTEQETLTVQQIPPHTHTMLGSTTVAASTNPQANVPASLPAASTASAYGNATNLVNFDPTAVAPVGGSQPHENMQPFLCISFIIAREGVFPSP